MTADSYLQMMLLEVDRAEQNLAEAKQRLTEAQAAHDVEEVKYAALRDAAAERIAPLGGDDSPYLHPEFWPTCGEHWGRFRFTRMNAGDAAVLALMESEESLTAIEVMQRVHAGGGSVDMRALNAALQQRSGIQKYEGGDGVPATYWYGFATDAGGDLDAADLPF